MFPMTESRSANMAGGGTTPLAEAAFPLKRASNVPKISERAISEVRGIVATGLAGGFGFVGKKSLSRVVVSYQA